MNKSFQKFAFASSFFLGISMASVAQASLSDQGNIPYPLPYVNSTLGCTHDKVLTFRHTGYGVSIFFYYGCSGYDQNIVYDLGYSGGTIKRTPVSSQMKTTIFACYDDTPANCSVNNQTTGFTQYEDQFNTYLSINNTIYNTSSGVYAAEKEVFGTTIFNSALEYPLSGFPGTTLLDWGDTWTFGECPTGVDKLHSGLDVAASTGDDIFAAEAGTVKRIFTDEHSTWGDAIVIEHTGGHKAFTTVYWHVEKVSGLDVNDSVTKGEHIADVFNLGGNTHFHFGIRMGAYDANDSLAGGLPVSNCSPWAAFPAGTIDPATAIYQ